MARAYRPAWREYDKGIISDNATVVTIEIVDRPGGENAEIIDDGNGCRLDKIFFWALNYYLSAESCAIVLTDRT